ncbi:MAG: hypothetical protein ACLFOY_15450 [Desulfatibacillaceae bacterium]
MLQRIAGRNSRGAVSGSGVLVVFLIAILAAAGWYFGNHAVIRTKNDIFFLKKSAFGFDKIYVNTTKWGPPDYASNPEITAALTERGVKKALNQEE